MIRNVLEHIRGVEAFPIVSLVLFVLVFAGAVWWALSLSRPFVDHASQLPLDPDAPSKGNAP